MKLTAKSALGQEKSSSAFYKKNRGKTDCMKPKPA
jgi:hypothetical protein